MKRILFLPLYESNIRVFMPIVEKLRTCDGVEPLVVFLEKVHTDGLTRFLDSHGLPYMKVNLFPRIVGTKFDRKPLTMRAMQKHVFTLFYTRRETRKLFSALGPALIVTTNEAYYAERFFLQEAERRGIPSLSLFSVVPGSVVTRREKRRGVFGRLLDVASWLLYRFRSALVHCYTSILTFLGLPAYNIPTPSRGRATKVCVWNEPIKRTLVEQGGVAEKIVATGAPACDLIWHMDAYFGQKTINQIHERLEIERDKEIILFISQPLARDGLCTFEEQRSLTELIIGTCARFDGHFLVIKLHPREMAKEYAYLEGHPLKTRFRLMADKDADLYDLIYASQVVLAEYSTAVIDAILFDKRVISLSLITKGQPNYVKAGAALDVGNRSGLFDALARSITDKDVQDELGRGRKRFIAEHHPEFDGKATDRVVDLISGLLGDGCSCGRVAGPAASD